MRRPTKMLLMSSHRDRAPERTGQGDRYEYAGGTTGMEYRPENPQNPWETENRFRDRRGREHYDNGRFAPARSQGGDINPPYDSIYPRRPYYPPIYQNGGEGGGTMNKIGFAIQGEGERLPETYRQREYPERYGANEMEPRKGSRTMGFASAENDGGITPEEAREWARAMENEDGTQGPHWNMEQTRQVQAQQGIDCDPVEFYLAMNMMYSDYLKPAKKLGVNKVDFYACMAKAFLDDKDAGPGKVRRYFEYVAGK